MTGQALIGTDRGCQNLVVVAEPVGTAKAMVAHWHQVHDSILFQCKLQQLVCGPLQTDAGNFASVAQHFRVWIGSKGMFLGHHCFQMSILCNTHSECHVLLCKQHTPVHNDPFALKLNMLSTSQLIFILLLFSSNPCIKTKPACHLGSSFLLISKCSSGISLKFGVIIKVGAVPLS